MPPIMDWTTDISGVWFSPKLSRDVRVHAQTKQRFRQLVRPEPDFGAHMGNQYNFTKMGNLAARGQIIGEHDDVPVTDFAITEAQVTVNEISNSVERTWWSSLFSELSVEHGIIMNLMNDAAQTLDLLVAAEFRTADLVYTPTGTVSNKTYTLSTTGTAGATATRNMSAWDVKNIVDLMRTTYNMPFYRGGDSYMCISSTTALRGLKDDSEFIESAKYADPTRLMVGEVGSYYTARYIEENNALDGNLAGGLGEMIFIADDPVVEIEVYPLEVQAKVADSYGRFRGLRWVTIVGWEKSWDFSTDGQARLVRVHSL